MNEISYKNFIIQAIPQLVESERWTLNIKIHKYGCLVNIKDFYSSTTTFDTEEEAIDHCFNFGKQIIDGQISNCTVDDLLGT